MAPNNHSSFLISISLTKVKATSSITHLKKYPFSLLCILLIFLLSFTPFFPETPFDEVQFIDKWTHLVMYGGTTCVMWWEYLRNCRKEARKPNLQVLFWVAFGVRTSLLHHHAQWRMARLLGRLHRCSPRQPSRLVITPFLSFFCLEINILQILFVTLQAKI